jgi:hypothetical protein
MKTVKKYGEARDIAPSFCPCTRWRAVSFTSCPFYPQGNSRLGEPQRRSESRKASILSLYRLNLADWNVTFVTERMLFTQRAGGRMLGSGTMQQDGRLRVRFSDENRFFGLPILSSRAMAQGNTQPLTGMSTRNLPRGKKTGGA